MQKHKIFRMTHQREVILEELRKVDSHPSADEVYEMVRKRIPRISLGTVYRNLEILSDNGEIRKLEPNSAVKRFDGNPEGHYHVRCVYCDRIADVPFDLKLRFEPQLSAHCPFEIIGHTLEFQGICPLCAEKLQDSNVSDR